MSTKVYNGFRLVAGADPFDFLAHAQGALVPLRDRLDAQSLMQSYAASCDQLAFASHTDNKPQSIQEHARQSLVLLGRLPESALWLNDPHAIAIWLGWEPVSRRYMGFVNSSAQEVTDAVWSFSEVEQFDYWDNADQPQGVSEADWQERAQAWHRMIHPALDEHCMHWEGKSFNLDQYYDDVLAQPALLREAHSYKARAERLATWLLGKQKRIADKALTAYSHVSKHPRRFSGESHREWELLEQGIIERVAKQVQPLLDPLPYQVTDVFSPTPHLRDAAARLEALVCNELARSAQAWLAKREG